MARSPFRLLGVYDDQHSYHLTTKAWAEALDCARVTVEGRWGTEAYRKFRLYLWGCAQALQHAIAQAYRWVLEKPVAG